MASAGELLREERIKRNLTVRDIADSTRISARYLEAVEVGDLSTLPGDFFYRAFIKQYAIALDLDELTTNRVLAAAAPAVEQDPIPALSAAYQVAQSDSRAGEGRRTGTTGAIVLLAAVLVACSAMYAIWHKSETASEAASEKVSPPVAKQEEPKPEAPVATAPAAEPQPAPTTEQQPAATTAEPVPAPAQASTPPPVTLPAGSTSVELAANEKSWVTLSSDGKTLFAGLLDVSQTKTFAVGANAKLLAGNAGGVDVRFNGKPIGPIGPHGQVRVVMFSGGNFQIVTPQKKSGA